MKVCIEKTPDGQFSVYEEIDPATEVAPNTAAVPPTETEEGQANAQKAQDLQGALMLAAKLLSSSENDQQQAAFDQGLAKSNPTMTM